MAELDPRIMRVGIEVRGQMRFYDQLAITAQGEKYANFNQTRCNITIANLERSVRDYILTETSPINANRNPKRITLEVGRVSTGYSLLFSGNLYRSSISQPPDQILSIRTLAGQFQKTRIVQNNLPGNQLISRIAGMIASDIEANLDFQATDRTISNYSFTGSALQQIRKLEAYGGIDVFLDNDSLTVRDSGTLPAGQVRLLSPTNGMIGMPEPTEQGIKVNFFYDNHTNLNTVIDLRSERFPTFNGRYRMYKLGFNIANRDTPFYYTAECQRPTGVAARGN